MLSVTKTIPDVKAKLYKDFRYWRFESEQLYSDMLALLSDDVYREVMYHQIGEVTYNSLKAKDGIFNDMEDEYVYYAEIYMICYYFMIFKEIHAENTNVAASSFSDDGYSQSVSYDVSKSAYSVKKQHFMSMAKKMFDMAGYNVNDNFGIRNSIHTGSHIGEKRMSDIYFGRG